MWRAAVAASCRHRACMDGVERLACLARRLGAAVEVRELPEGVESLTVATDGARVGVAAAALEHGPLLLWAGYHTLAHVLLGHGGVRVCSDAAHPRPLECLAARTATSALAIPPSMLPVPEREACAMLGMPPISFRAFDVMSRQYGTRPGGVTADEVASLWTEGSATIRWLLAKPRVVRSDAESA